MRIYVTGDSHGWPLFWGFQKLQGEGLALEIMNEPVGWDLVLRAPFFVREGDRLRITAEGETFRPTGSLIPSDGFQPDLCVASVFFHTAHLLWHYFGRNVPFACFQSGDHMPVSDALLRAIADEGQRYAREYLKTLRDLGFPVVVAEAPKLFRHNPNVSNMRHEILHYFDRLYRDRARDWMRAEGFVWVDVPPHLVAEDLFMHEQYRADIPGDQHHGNAEFGQIMADLVLKAHKATTEPAADALREPAGIRRQN